MRKAKTVKEVDGVAGVGARTRMRLLEVGERLFAASGIGGTPTRQICREAGVHQDAIRYHFGTKEEFVRAILDANVQTLDEHLASRLEEAGSRDTASSLRALAEAAVAANAAIAAGDGLGRHFPSFLASVMSDPRHRSLALGRPSPWSDRMLAALTPLTPTLSEIERTYRIAVAGFLLVHVKGAQPAGGLIDEWMSGQAATGQGQMQAMLTDALVGVLGAPSGSRPARRTTSRANRRD